MSNSRLRSSTPPVGNGVSSAKADHVVMAAVKGHVSSLEDKLGTEIRRVQQQGDRLREAAFSRVESKLSAVESLQPKYDRRMAELSGNVKGLSDEMQSQLRRIDQMDSRLWEWRHQLEEELRSRITEVEQAVQQLTSSQRVAKTSNEEALKRLTQRVLRVEGVVDEHHSHAEETNRGLLQLHSRISELEEGHNLHAAHSEEMKSRRALAFEAEGESGVAAAAMEGRLAELDLQVKEAVQKLDTLQQESHDLRSRVEMQDEKGKSLRTLHDAKEEQYRSMLDRIERENLDGRMKVLQAKVQEMETQSVSTAEQLMIANQKLESLEQDATVAGAKGYRLPSPRFERPGTMTPTSAGDLIEVHGTKAVTEEVRSCSLRLDQLDSRLSSVDADVEALKSEQSIYPHVSALVSQLKDITPKVIQHEAGLRDLTDQVAVHSSKSLELQRSADKVKSRIGNLEVEVNRLLQEVEGVGRVEKRDSSVSSQVKPGGHDSSAEEQDDEDDLVEAAGGNSAAAARAKIQLSRANQSRASLSGSSIQAQLSALHKDTY
eukprot:TRINITY_DN8177_c0_g1_i1.p1 TRINITY_DN8177_c0_g1~~TRINITY_DN8177_c0_g1_i1.p1  ORF type:complete len:599 (+),score=161.53 TRINITY_DN8177_c0_g1_i1:160-1797(+)